MAITFVATPLVRPAGLGSPALPLIERNPQNDPSKKDYGGDGPACGLRIGPNDYRMYHEGFWNRGSAITPDSTSGDTFTFNLTDGSNIVLTVT